MSIHDVYERWRERPFALDQSTHEAINAAHYPGTRQLCCVCDQPTHRCEEDTMSCEKCELRPLCEDCKDEHRGHDEE